MLKPPQGGPTKPTKLRNSGGSAVAYLLFATTVAGLGLAVSLAVASGVAAQPAAATPSAVSPRRLSAVLRQPIGHNARASTDPARCVCS